ncbi:MAG TPA: ABC transporter substrate-binding protein [Gaiellaceae bacterium]|nr:ABC transporter substrate-binding protein [Gaiellaceae bacterium]
MNRRTGLRLAALLGLVAVAVAAVGASTGLSRPLAGKHATASNVIIDGTTGTVVNIDPANQYDYDSFTLDLPLFQGLYGFPHGAKLQPVLATGCKASANLKTWTCGLRHNVKFSDGTPMTSADVKWSFDRVLKIKGDQGIWTLLSNLKSTTVSGPYTVVFHLKEPDSIWPYILSTNAGYVVPKAKYPFNKILSNTDPQVGTGPYKLVKFTPGQQAVLTPNPFYWGPKPKNGGIIINYYSKSSTMKLALEKGEIDMAFQSFTPTELASLKKEKGIVVHSGHGVVIRYLVFNVVRPPFNSLAVRKAIAYLIPRQDIATRVYHNTVVPLYSMVPAGLPGHIDAFKSLYGASPSVAKAKAVLAKAGVKTPLPITIWWTPSHYGDASADEYAEIQRSLNSSGLFKVTLKSAEWAQYSGALGKTYGAFQLGWFPDYPDADDYTVSFYQPNAFYNNGYSDPKMTKLIAQERAARTNGARMAALRAMQTLGAKDLPTIPYWQGNMIAVSKSNIQGVNSTLDAAYYMRFWLLSKS